MSFVGIEALIGATLTKAEQVEGSDDRIVFETTDGAAYAMYHSQDCCEGVYVESIVGDLSDLIGSPILQAEEVTHTGGVGDYSDWPESIPLDDSYESYTWTFYKLATIKGGVTIRWIGSSNGYYSESVDFAQVRPATHDTGGGG